MTILIKTSWETKSQSASQEFLRLLWNPKLHYRVRKSPPLTPTLTQMHLVHNFPPNVSKTFPNNLSKPEALRNFS
jgi:hypothetical protein